MLGFSAQEPRFPNQVRYQAALHSDARICLGLGLLDRFGEKRNSGTDSVLWQIAEQNLPQELPQLFAICSGYGV